MSEELKMIVARLEELQADDRREVAAQAARMRDLRIPDFRRASFAAAFETRRGPRLEEIKGLTERKLKLEDEAKAREALVADAEQRAQVDDANFWFRRFHTSLAIAHGAAFAAIGSKLFDKETPVDVIVAAWHPMAIFAAGMVVAGAIPLPIYLRRQRLAWWLAGASALMFVAGLVAALTAMWLRAGMVWPWQA